MSPRIAISIAFVLRGFVQGSWYPRIPGVASQVDVDAARLGTIFFLFALGNIIAFALAARLITTIGSPRTHAIFAVPFALIVIALSWVSTPLEFGVGMFVFGVFTGVYDISTSVQGAVVERQTGRSLISVLYGLFSVGALCGSFSSGLLAGIGVTIPAQFASIAVVSIPLTMLITITMMPDDIVPAPSMRKKRLIPTLPPKVLLPLGLTIICIALGEETINNWVALYLRESLGTSAAVGSWAYTAFAVSTAIGRLLGDNVIAKFGVDRTLVTGSFAAALGVGLGMAINQPWAIILGYTVMGLGLSVVVPVTYRRANQIPDISPASAVATVASIGFLGFLVGPLLIGAVAEITSLRVAISSVAMILLGVAVLTKLNPTPSVMDVMPGTDTIGTENRGEQWQS